MNLGHTGVHMQRYNVYTTNKNSKKSISPHKEATTFYYQSDGSGRDGYILMDNGGSRPEYERYNPSPNKIFYGSLRNDLKSPLRYFKDSYRDKADITTYLNWSSKQGNQVNAKHARI